MICAFILGSTLSLPLSLSLLLLWWLRLLLFSKLRCYGSKTHCQASCARSGGRLPCSFSVICRVRWNSKALDINEINGLILFVCLGYSVGQKKH